MTLSNRTHVGCRVIGSHGPLQSNPNASIKRRVQQKVVGTVIRASGSHTWDVIFDYNGMTKSCKSGSLKIVPNETGIPLPEARSQFSPPVENGDTRPGVIEGSRSNVASVSISIEYSSILF